MLVSVTVGCAEMASKPESFVAQNSPTPVATKDLYKMRWGVQAKVEDCPQSVVETSGLKLPRLNQMAVACAQNKKADRLEMVANQMAKQFVNEPWGPFYLSVAAEQKAEFTRALWMIELAIKKSPKNGLLYFQRGRVRWALQEFASGIEDYNTALKFDDSIVDAHLFLGQMAIESHDYNAAQKHYVAALKIEQDNHLIAIALGDTAKLMGQNQAAIEYYELASQLSPSNIDIQLRLADLYENFKKDGPRALDLYRRARNLILESRHPASQQEFDINEKIKKLESAMKVEKAKLTTARESQQGQVKQ
jgi:tetratricopeptide (TPR) repeat protein